MPSSDPDYTVRIVDANGDPDWSVITVDGIDNLSPASGDLLQWNGTAWVSISQVNDANIPAAIARDTEVTTAVAAEASARTTADGLLIPKSTVTAKGSLIVATAASTPANHAAGADGKSPIWDASATDGVRNATMTEAGAFGLLGWAYDPEIAMNNNLVTAAQIYLARIPLRRQLSVTNLLANLGAVAVSPTHAYGLLYTSSGVLIGQSADQSANLIAGSAPAGTGLKTMALANGPFLCTPASENDWVWGALYVGTAGTAPSWSRGSSTVTLLNANLAAATARFGKVAKADTATPGNFTPGSDISLTGESLWMGLS